MNKQLSEELAAIDHAHAVARLHPDGTIVDVNDRFLSLFGYERAELIGRNHAILATTEDKESGAYQMFWAALRAGRAFTQRCKRKANMGRSIYLQVIYTPVIDSAGRLTRIVELATDVTDVVLTEQALERARQTLEKQRDMAVARLEGFFHASLDALCLVDPEGRFLSANGVMEELLGCGAVLEGAPLVDVVHPDDRRRTRRAMVAVRRGAVVRNFVNRCRCPRGRFIFVEWRAKRVGDVIYAAARERRELAEASAEMRQPGAVVATANRKLGNERASILRKAEDRASRLQAQLADACAESRARAEFLANMSHELRTPLHAIIGYTELVHEEMQIEGRVQAARDLDRVLRASEHLLKLVNDVLDLSKAEAGKLLLRPGEVDVRSLVEEVLDVCRPAAQARGNAVAARFEGVPPGLWLDDLRLRQCLINLVSNAVRFTEGGLVCVEAHWKRDRLWLSVRDTGVGISPDVLVRLFQPFVQGDYTGSVRRGGTGLGLVITRRLAELMGGAVSVESEVGVGSTFLFEIDAPAMEMRQVAIA